jgi:hypothetical protein
MTSAIKIYCFNRWLFLILLVIFMLPATSGLKAQEPPPRPIRINATAQGLSFGAFYHGASGGTITINPSGIRTSTGDIVLLNLGFTYTAALFEVHAHPGTVISVVNGLDATLSGTPSGTMTLHIGDSNPASPFVSNVQFNVAIPLYIGGILTVGNSAANPPGSYTGTFEITIVRE